MKKYSSVCSKIIEHYSYLLEEKEILAIKKILKLDNYDNLNIIIFINKIIDKVWQNILKKPHDYKEGENFTFLTTRDLLPNVFNLSVMTNFEKNQKFFLELITDKTIINSVDGINGIIVEIDYKNSFSEPLLPIDFQENKRILAKTKLDILGIYNISLGLEKYDASFELSENFAELINLPYININKTLYNYQKNNAILDKIDKDSIANIIITYYLLENNLDKVYEIIHLRDILKKQYKKEIIREYEKYFYKYITLEEFMNNIFDMLENAINLSLVDKIV